MSSLFFVFALLAEASGRTLLEHILLRALIELYFDEKLCSFFLLGDGLSGGVRDGSMEFRPEASAL